MPSIAQQDYKIIAPKQDRSFAKDAAALGELKKAILNGIGFDCIIKDTVEDEGDFNRVLGLYPDNADVWSKGNGQVLSIKMPYTVPQYQGLAAIQHAIDEKYGLMQNLPSLEYDGEDNSIYVPTTQVDIDVCVDGKKIITTVVENMIKALTLSETGPAADVRFVNITWEDAQKLIGLPIS